MSVTLPGTTSSSQTSTMLDFADGFIRRHIGPSASEMVVMLDELGFDSLDSFTDATVPAEIRLDHDLDIPAPRGEREFLIALKTIASKNKVYRSCIGMGYTGTVTPPVILRNVLENPGWYTQYTPYQAEIAQGRLEALLNFQTMIADLTGLPLAGASLLDEATAAAEAMGMCASIANHKKTGFYAADDCHPQTLALLKTRATGLGIDLKVGPIEDIDFAHGEGGLCGVLVQYPTTDGQIVDYRDLAKQAADSKCLLVAAADLLALTVLTPPGEWGADICIGSAQRFGVPMGLGGPHAAFISTHDKFARKLPGRLIGVSKDSHGDRALRMAIQTREQHIRRDKATSNICTAQALLAIISSFYAVYHGPDGLKQIATRTQAFTGALALGLEKLGHKILGNGTIFDTIRIELGKGRRHAARQVADAARERQINLREYADGTLGVTLDETTDRALVADLLAAFNFGHYTGFDVDALLAEFDQAGRLALGVHQRTSEYLTHPVFHQHRSETQLLRYIFKLMGRDLSLAHSMIALGSCTMKLNATSEMIPVTWTEFADIHPFAPDTQWRGYTHLFRELEQWLCEVTGFAAVSLQPNAGAQGEYAGLLVIRAYHEHMAKKAGVENRRHVCLIPTSAHGTNPASAVMAGMKVIPVACNDRGDVDMDDLKAKAETHADDLSALMITYPSTHGVFESTIREVCDIIHRHGGQVYMDGANMNAQVGLTSPGNCGADVCHLNLHKTFCIPHGGGGPGMGPIAVASQLAPFLPEHPVERPDTAGEFAIGPVSAAPYGSPSILTISYVYIAMMGAAGLKQATQVAILNANYMAKRLSDHYDILYTDANGRVAHEFIVDCRAFEKSADVKIEDIAKRLMDYGFHGPTMSWPVPGTLMIEPTESESKDELDRFCDAMIAIRKEIAAIEAGEMDRQDNPLKNSPHTMGEVGSDNWSHPYTREQAAWPMKWLRDAKFWPTVGRIDNTYGDRNLVCSCPPMENYGE
ncbi:aminomethyl-transferring glycine dehydrogenase [Rubripirellula amarantea]|uniref:Glycine dehydrogenase (decarboxylating) n=1 Tax=Rubripirellula amarantea TaxID=2527999 RepID=A0A5C5WW06_9BACT|nr:aminomethyl-transferring glycine dehydrogenase [Rubripirellula amarantea]MDA8744919.1 aminomethyl-transferring glycine dehydrogenase [Rubripirellula amarantea]TWT54750.1 Glycine dehydrogenase (decarboxylating) [Rubripirellula amarantea]